jgi:transcription termination factor NusB
MIKKNKGSRSWSRILAVQALYQLSLNKDAKESKVIKDLIQNKESKNRADKIFLSKLVKETIKKKNKIS